MLTLECPTLADFRDTKSLAGYLGRQLTRGRLTLVLGAGMSTYFGLPDWKVLIRRLYRLRRAKPPADRDLTGQAEYFRQKYHGDNYRKFVKAVGIALYKVVSLDFARMASHRTLNAVSSVIFASHVAGSPEIITFNWDDILEQYLKYSGLVVCSVTEPTQWGGGADVDVLHPHGFIPFNRNEPPSKKIVFDQLSYTAELSDIASPWRTRLLSNLRTHTCIFLGLSGRDANLDSLLYATCEHHSSRNEGTPFWGVTLSTSRDKALGKQWKERGIYVKHVADYKTDLPNFLYRVCQSAADFRQRLATSVAT